MRTILTLAALSLTILAGCAYTGVSSNYRSAQQGGFTIDKPLNESLFPEDQWVLSNDTINQVLSSQVELPTAGKVVVIRLNDPGLGRWSAELAEMQQAAAEQLCHQLETSARVQQAMYLPDLLRPKSPGVPQLRAAAARCQAHLILVYNAYSRTFQKSRLFKADQMRSHCVVEAVLIDTRTGIIPFTTTAVESYEAQMQGDDYSTAEALWKAESLATAQALARIGHDVVAFLDALPAANPQ